MRAWRIQHRWAHNLKNVTKTFLTILFKRGGLTAKNQPLTRAVETVQPASVMESKQTIVCQSFSDDNYNVTVSNGKRSVKRDGVFGYCFLNHEKIKQDQILKWSLRVPKHRGGIGMVIILELIIFDFL